MLTTNVFIVPSPIFYPSSLFSKHTLIILKILRPIIELYNLA